MSKLIGVYRIKNIITLDCYIGSSTDIKERWRRHNKDLRKGKHHSIILQRAWNKYGEAAFIFEIIEYCTENVLDREQFYLDTEFPMYNINKEATSSKGRIMPEEERIKRRAYALAHNIKPPASTYMQKRKAVCMLDKDTGVILKEFCCLSDACKYVGKSIACVSTISSVCRGNTNRRTAFGYKWKYKND